MFVTLLWVRQVHCKQSTQLEALQSQGQGLALGEGLRLPELARAQQVFGLLITITSRHCQHQAGLMLNDH
jgi:hypothetical protein